MKLKSAKSVNYVIRINSDFYQAFTTLREARNHIRKLSAHHVSEELTVELLKQSVIEVVMNTYTTKPVNVLTAAELGDA